MINLRIFSFHCRNFPIPISKSFSNPIFAFQRSRHTTNVKNTIMAKVTERSNSADISCLEDIEPPFGKFLSGRYKRSFAYTTIKDRLPVILTRIIDTFSRNKDEITKTYGPGANEEIKQVIGAISKLKNELVTNKALLPLQPIPGRENDDAAIWNRIIENLSTKENETQTWYNTKWLISECYMYRRLAQEILSTTHLKSYDHFESQKQEAYQKSLTSMNFVTEHVLKAISNQNANLSEKEENVINLIKLDLWGNRCDLSLSEGQVNTKDENPLHTLKSLDKEILVDNSKEVWEVLKKYVESGKNNSIVDIVLDNAGYELFTDLCLALYLTEKKLTSKVRFYVKRYPWFISDVTTKDFHWVINEMVNSKMENIKSFGKLCEKYVKDGIWTVEEESFWTEPFDFSEMKSVNPVLYNKLSEAILVIIKGDLNYRKLMGDINWEYSTDFLEALRGFRPTNLLSLRTVKADTICGLPSGKGESLKAEEPNWMETGRYGLIQASIQLS